jgi:hypothetical protein
MFRLSRAALLGVAGMVVVSGTAWALPQTTAQQKCIDKINQNGDKVHEAQGGNNRACVKSFGKGSLMTTAEACMTADTKGKVAKTQGKTTATEMKFCGGSGLPDFGFTSAANVNSVADQAELDLMHDLFGTPIDNGLFKCDPNTNQCLCQRNAINRIEKLMSVMPRIFALCKKAYLTSVFMPAPAASAADLQRCWEDAGMSQSVAADSGTQIAQVVTLLNGTLTSDCDATSVTAASFTGPKCNGLSGTAAQDCINALVRCRTCVMINAEDGLSSNCDLFDNGAADASCP